jgi:hypothetical protein
VTRIALATFLCGLSLPTPILAVGRTDDPAPRFVLAEARIERDGAAAPFDLREARVEDAAEPTGYALSAVRIVTGAASCGPRPELVHASGFETGE